MNEERDLFRAIWIQRALLCCAVLLTSGHRFQNDFVFDDVAMFVDGDVIHDLANLPRAWTKRTMFVSAADDGTVDSVDTYRPLTVTTFFVDATWSGRDPLGYHLTGLLLHLIATFSVAGVARRSFANGAAATFGALVFAVHPWLVEAHVWINGRSDSLALALALAAAFLLIGKARARYPLAAVAFLAALLAKETALLLLPAIALLPCGGVAPAPRELVRRAGALGVAAVLYLAVRVVVLEGARVGSGDTLWAALRVLPVLCVDALRQTLVPTGVALRSLRDDYAVEPWQLVASWSLLVAIAGGVWLLRKRPVVIAASVWFFAPLLPSRWR